MSKVLIAEDNLIKQDNIKKLLNNINVDYVLVETYSECWKTIFYDTEEYNAVILDMSLPRYKNERPYKFAGYDILRRLYYKEINIPVILLTGHVQYTIDKFKYDLDAVIEMIHNEDRIKKADIVYYDNKSKSWENKIIEFLIEEGVINENSTS